MVLIVIVLIVLNWWWCLISRVVHPCDVIWQLYVNDELVCSCRFDLGRVSLDYRRALEFLWVDVSV